MAFRPSSFNIILEETDFQAQGASIARAHFRDDPCEAKPEKVNLFDYSIPSSRFPTNQYCPFFAHVRKSAPRNLDPFLSRKYLESSLINRTGIPYGEEVFFFFAYRGQLLTTSQ